MADDKILNYNFNEIYALYLQKTLRKNRTEEELLSVITWLTGYTKEQVNRMVDNVILGEFFNNAPLINPNAGLITGSICGVKVQEVKDPTVQKIRYLDKLVDELAKGKSMEKILRKG